MRKMRNNACLAIPLVLVFAATLFAWQGSLPTRGDNPAASPEWVELGSSMHEMHRAMALVRASGNGDLDFVQLMLPHHQAAIAMARSQLMYGKDPQMRRMAQEIITDQQSEIELMQLWLKQHGANSPQANARPDPGVGKEH